MTCKVVIGIHRSYVKNEVGKVVFVGEGIVRFLQKCLGLVDLILVNQNFCIEINVFEVGRIGYSLKILSGEF